MFFERLLELSYSSLFNGDFQESQSRCGEIKNFSQNRFKIKKVGATLMTKRF